MKILLRSGLSAPSLFYWQVLLCSFYFNSSMATAQDYQKQEEYFSDFFSNLEDARYNYASQQDQSINGGV